MIRQICWALVSAGALGLAAAAAELPPEQRKAIDKGLEWIASAQARDGHWQARGGRHSTSPTARAGLALLMEGSTPSRGKYRDHIRKAVDWLVERAQNNGLIYNTTLPGAAKDSAKLGQPAPGWRRFAANVPGEARDYMEGHGFAMLFLASVYGQEQHGDRRKKLEKVLTRAVDFCGQAQTDAGGWGYVSAKEAGAADVGDLTVMQMQGLRACQDAGIPGTKPILDKALKYLEKCTTPGGSVTFTLRGGGERPNLTVAALVGSFSAGQYDSDLVKKWLLFCRNNISLDSRFDRDGYARYYYAQALHTLGDDGFERLFPRSPAEDRLTWSRYKKPVFDQLIGSQGRDGSWKWAREGLLLTTMNVTILQLDSTTLPIYRHPARKEDGAKFKKE
jgi:hypothetical protein